MLGVFGGADVVNAKRMEWRGWGRGVKMLGFPVVLT